MKVEALLKSLAVGKKGFDPNAFNNRVLHEIASEMASSFFSSPEPKAPGELIVWEASVVRRPPHFQTTSPLKPIGQM